jgi:hypothetical protein
MNKGYFKGHAGSVVDEQFPISKSSIILRERISQFSHHGRLPKRPLSLWQNPVHEIPPNRRISSAIRRLLSNPSSMVRPQRELVKLKIIRKSEVQNENLSQVITANLIFHLDSLHYRNKSLLNWAHFEEISIKESKY